MMKYALKSIFENLGQIKRHKKPSGFLWVLKITEWVSKKPKETQRNPKKPKETQKKQK